MYCMEVEFLCTGPTRLPSTHCLDEDDDTNSQFFHRRLPQNYLNEPQTYPLGAQCSMEAHAPPHTQTRPTHLILRALPYIPRAGDGSTGERARAWGWLSHGLSECGCDTGRCRLLIGIVLRPGRCVCACEREVCLGAFVSCCFACGCVLELVVCRVRFARVSCPWLRFGVPVQYSTVQYCTVLDFKPPSGT